MAPCIGYLLPTRERIMEGFPDTVPLLELAERAEGLGFNSVWIGDSLTSRPRHEPLVLLAAVAGRTKRVSLGTAVLLPALRQPVLMAHQIATLDQASGGRVIIAVGIAHDIPKIHAEFEAAGVPWEKRIGRMIEGLQLCRALWAGQPVEWAGRWTLRGETISPTPYQTGGPPIWGGGMVTAALHRAAKYFDGWLPNGPHPEHWGEQWRELRQSAAHRGRNPDDLTGAVYVTVCIDDDVDRAEERVGDYLERYYGFPAEQMKQEHTYFAGPPEGVAEWLSAFAEQGVNHFVLRFVGDHERQLAEVAKLRVALGW